MVCQNLDYNAKIIAILLIAPLYPVLSDDDFNMAPRLERPIPSGNRLLDVRKHLELSVNYIGFEDRDGLFHFIRPIAL